MKLLTHEQMSALTTKRLLAYKNSLMRVPEKAVHIMYDTTQRICKDNPKWIKTYGECKAILATREHVDKKRKIYPCDEKLTILEVKLGDQMLYSGSSFDTDHKR